MANGHGDRRNGAGASSNNQHHVLVIMAMMTEKMITKQRKSRYIFFSQNELMMKLREKQFFEMRIGLSMICYPNNEMTIEDINRLDIDHPVLGDIFHLMDRVKVPTHHSFKVVFFRALRGAMFIMHNEDVEKVKQVLSY